MSLRHVALGALLGFVISLAPSCGTPTPACKPSNCAGCCDKNNECQAGNQTFACGTRATMCAECGTGQSCVDAKCSGAGAGGGSGGGSGTGGGGTTSSCNSMSCNGCCSSDGFCRGGNTNQTCGKMGEACAMCPAGQACQMAACAAITCTMGCKDMAGACLAGNADLACGSAGASCVACPAGQVCSNGSCAAPCNATTCPSGCCDGSTCIGAPTAAKCGLNGGACQMCPGAMTCQGGVCQAGAGGGAGGGSGAGGGAGGGVPTSCNAGNCFDGCCNGITCYPGTASANCGIFGAACKACSAMQFCAFQSCFP